MLHRSQFAADADRPPISDRLIDALIWAPPTEDDGNRWGLVPYFEGLPGVAKTDRLRKLARRFTGWPSKVLAAGRLGEAAFAAVPYPWTYPGEDMPVMIYPPPSWVRPFERAADVGGLLVLDEYTTSRGLDAQLMGITLGGTVGDYELPARVRVVALGNPVYLAAQARELSLPERNRMIWLPWGPPTPEDRAAWQMGLTSAPAAPEDPADRERRTLAAWPAHYSRAHAFEAGFLRAHPAMKNREPREGEHAFASDRSWSMATRAIATAALHGLSEAETEMLVRGCVGEEAATAFSIFRRENDVSAPVDVLTAEGVAAHTPYRHADRAFVFLTNCATHLAKLAPDAQVDPCRAMHKLLTSYSASHADLAKLTVVALGKGGAGTTFHSCMKGDKAAMAAFASYQAI